MSDSVHHRPVGDDLGLDDLDPEERASLTAEQIEGVRTPAALVGRFRLRRLARDVIPFWCGALLVPMFAGLGAPLAAVGLALLLVALFVWRERRVVRVIDIDEAGGLRLGRHGILDWGDVDVLDVRPSPPLLTPKSRRPAAVWTLRARFTMRDGRTIRLAPGQLFQIRPRRRPLGIDQLARHLRRLARAAALTVTTTDEELGAWRAEVSPAPR